MSFLAFDLIKDTKALFSVAALARLSFQGVSMPPISLEECRIADVCWGPSSTLICAQQALYPQSYLSSPSMPSLEHVFCLLSNMVICPVGRSLTSPEIHLLQDADLKSLSYSEACFLPLLGISSGAVVSHCCGPACLCLLPLLPSSL